MRVFGLRYAALLCLAAWLLWCDVCLWRQAVPGAPVGWGALAAGLAVQVFFVCSAWVYWRAGGGYWGWAWGLWRERPRGRVECSLLCLPVILLLASPFMVATALDYGDADHFKKRQTDQAMVYRCALPCDVLGLNRPPPADSAR